MAEKKEPVEAEQTLTAEDFYEAAAAIEYFAHPMRRRGVRAAMCATAAAISTSLIYFCAARMPKILWLPVTAAGVFLLLSAMFYFLPPSERRSRAEKWLASCPLASLPSEISVFKDHAVLKNKCEKITEYFTDFTICAETDRLIAAAGGRQRYLLIVKKSGLPPETAKAFSECFRYAFDGRYYRFSGKGGI